MSTANPAVTVGDLDPDVQGAMYEVAEFAGLAGDEGADADFAAMPKPVQLAIQTIASWANFDQEPAAASASSGTGSSPTAGPRAAAEAATAKRPLPKLNVHPSAVVKAENGTANRMAADHVIKLAAAALRRRKPDMSEAQAVAYVLEHDETCRNAYNDAYAQKQSALPQPWRDSPGR